MGRTSGQSETPGGSDKAEEQDDYAPRRAVYGPGGPTLREVDTDDREPDEGRQPLYSDFLADGEAGQAEAGPTIRLHSPDPGRRNDADAAARVR